MLTDCTDELIEISDENLLNEFKIKTLVLTVDVILAAKVVEILAIKVDESVIVIVGKNDIF